MEIDPRIGRTLDANLNRAREAFRVMEDVARFTLDDATLSQRIKTTRHALAEIFNRSTQALIERCRDINGDVGRETTTPAEYTRHDSGSIASAAAKRATEALRVLEEFAKTIDGPCAKRLEQLRYQAYELDRALTITAEAKERMGGVRLYVLITEALCARPWLETARLALEGGADCIQIREKELPDGELVKRSRRLAELCCERGALVIQNDRPDIARLAGANGVHVGQDDLSVSQARRIVGPDRIVGVSTHDLEQARAAMASVPDYIAVGPMFQTATKPQPHVPGPELLSAVSAETSLPLVAIGGIDADNVHRVIDAGARCVCVCGGVISRRDPMESAMRLKQVLTADR